MTMTTTGARPGPPRHAWHAEDVEAQQRRRAERAAAAEAQTKAERRAYLDRLARKHAEDLGIPLVQARAAVERFAVPERGLREKDEYTNPDVSALIRKRKK